MSKQMKKYCLVGKIVCNFVDYILASGAVLLTGALVVMKIFLA